MSNWTSGTYKIEEIETKIFLGTLTRVTTKGKFNIFKLDNGELAVVTFKDQPQILEMITKNIGSIFAIRFFKKDNPKFSYSIDTSVGQIDAISIASVMVLAHNSSERDRTIYTTETGLIVLD